MCNTLFLEFLRSKNTNYTEDLFYVIKVLALYKSSQSLARSTTTAKRDWWWPTSVLIKVLWLVLITFLPWIVLFLAWVSFSRAQSQQLPPRGLIQTCLHKCCYFLRWTDVMNEEIGSLKVVERGTCFSAIFVFYCSAYLRKSTIFCPNFYMFTLILIKTAKKYHCFCYSIFWSNALKRKQSHKNRRWLLHEEAKSNDYEHNIANNCI